MTPVHLGMGHYSNGNEYKPSSAGKKSLWGKKLRGSKKTTVRALNKFKDWDWNYCKVTFSSDMTKVGLSSHKSQTLAYLLKYDHRTGGWIEAFIPPTPERNSSIRQESWMSSLPISRTALSQATTTTNTPFSAWSWAVQYQTYSKTHSYNAILISEWNWAGLPLTPPPLSFHRCQHQNLKLIYSVTTEG